MLFKAEIGVCLFSSKDTAYVNWMSFGVTAFQSLDSIPGYLTTGLRLNPRLPDDRVKRGTGLKTVPG